MIAILTAVGVFLWHWGWAAGVVLTAYSLIHHAPAHVAAGHYLTVTQVVMWLLFCLAMYYFPSFRRMIFRVLVVVYRLVGDLLTKTKTAIKNELDKGDGK